MKGVVEVGRIVVTKTVSMPLEIAYVIQKLAEKLQTSESAVVRIAILEKAEREGVEIPSQWKSGFERGG
ncbi:ribbon-helix-helix protein, CopG family [Archaeoglobus profundus]|uniref:Uncharacterized protein n=1 Tax=Archaeoglobus profundus (strain DSM 5631 / JCM 9629 / NBRC 100127 / Av18) TaxID=572546 RepID=D2RFX2_ARCPA|nr:ribbon-helix-helix protein, CopG family [Archaeoglobus profundus]ADB57197.1 hypothetical protein Arcpr_0125 [Archaeoglobus profundus DSM 5631]